MSSFPEDGDDDGVDDAGVPEVTGGKVKTSELGALPERITSSSVIPGFNCRSGSLSKRTRTSSSSSSSPPPPPPLRTLTAKGSSMCSGTARSVVVVVVVWMCSLYDVTTETTEAADVPAAVLAVVTEALDASDTPLLAGSGGLDRV